MNDARPGAQMGQAQVAEQGLWDHAPAWRNLAMGAAALTAAAVALPLALPGPPQDPAKPSPAPVTASPAQPAAKAPAAPQAAAPSPQVIIVEKYIQAPPPAPAPAPLQAAVAAPAALPQPEAAACSLRIPPAPIAVGAGVVERLMDRATAQATIGRTQAQAGGRIDPDYVDNPRVGVRMDSGQRVTVLLPGAMVVGVGDRVTVQSAYRNARMPCNYIPNLVTADLGPESAAAGSPSPPPGT